jgi:hypothetical protein
MATQDQILDFYRQPAAMTAWGDPALLEGLPGDVAGLVKVIQGLLLHEHWAPAYGQTLSDARRSGSQLRSTEAMLAQLGGVGPLTQARPLDERLIGVCRHYSVLMAAMLRAAGVPARARCGFGAHFERGKFIDHWVAEYWNVDQGRWVMVDAQVDDFQKSRLNPDFDLLDVPRDRFIIAGDAWAACRAGRSDAAAYGIMDMWGPWFIAGNLIRDVAALNNVEMLPWDCWGAMAQPGEAIDDERAAFFDQLAALTHDPDEGFDALRRLYETDPRLTKPAVVFNAVLNRPEAA